MGGRAFMGQLQLALHAVFGPGRRRHRLRGTAALVRHCLVDLDQDGIWLTGGIAEFWSLTTEELKEVVRVAVEEARSVKPGALVQVMSSTDTAKQCVELTLHAQELGVDICYILTPYFECSGKPGVLEYLRYVADRTDMPLGFFNSHSTGLVLTPSECVELYHEIPALCGLKNGLLDAQHSLAVHKSRAGDGAVGGGRRSRNPAGNTSSRGARLRAVSLRKARTAAVLRSGVSLLVAGDFERAEKFAAETGLADMKAASRRYQAHPARPGVVHALGRGVQVRCHPARPAGRRLPPFTAAADRIPRRTQGPDHRARMPRPGSSSPEKRSVPCRCTWFRQGPAPRLVEL